MRWPSVRVECGPIEGHCVQAPPDQNVVLLISTQFPTQQPLRVEESPFLGKPPGTTNRGEGSLTWDPNPGSDSGRSGERPALSHNTTGLCSCLELPENSNLMSGCCWSCLIDGSDTRVELHRLTEQESGISHNHTHTHTHTTTHTHITHHTHTHTLLTTTHTHITHTHTHTHTQPHTLTHHHQHHTHT